MLKFNDVYKKLMNDGSDDGEMCAIEIMRLIRDLGNKSVWSGMGVKEIYIDICKDLDKISGLATLEKSKEIINSIKDELAGFSKGVESVDKFLSYMPMVIRRLTDLKGAIKNKANYKN